MINDIKTNKLLRKLDTNLPRQVSLPVVHAILDHMDPILGVACATYEKYAKASATGLRTVARTIPALSRHGLLRKQSRHDGPPVLWLPELMEMTADEAVRRAGWLAQYKDENPQNYFRAGRANVAGRAHARPANERARDEIEVEGEHKTTTPAHSNDQEVLRLIHGAWDAQGLTSEGSQALTEAIHATGKSRPEGLKHMDGRALRKAYRRARGRLPAGYDRWIDLVERWDKSYNRQKARNLVDRLIAAVGNRPRALLDKLFDHVGEQISDHWPKKVRRLECECERLENDELYIPQLRSLMRDEFADQVYDALADGPKTKDELKRLFGKTYGAISSVGRRLRNAGQIQTIWRGDEWMWARAGAAPLFVPARDAIVAALKKRPMSVPTLAQEIGKGTSTVKSALHRHLLPNGTVIRTRFGAYALAGTAPRYVSKGDAIVAALKNGPMTFQALAREIGGPPSSLPQFFEPLLAKGKVIRTGRGIYALPRSAPVFVPTSDAIIFALSKKPMKLGPLVQDVRKKVARSRSSIRTVLCRLKKRARSNRTGYSASTIWRGGRAPVEEDIRKTPRSDALSGR
jgi:lambda repressor-like predicted transcriptional regulator